MATRLDPTDIDLVLVTGAGASRDFGGNREPLPLMADWANLLAEKLWRIPAADEISGLKKGMTGPEFEARLGQFLNEVDGFYRAEGLIKPSSKFPLNPPVYENQLVSWYQTAKSQFKQITAEIHKSVYEQFNPNRLNGIGAAKAYGELLTRLGITPASSLVYATTNYDALGEQAFGQLGYLPDCGEPNAYDPQNSLRVSNLLQGLPRWTPMLHLHGKVGWLRRDDETTAPYFSGTTAYDPNFGLPIVMLPDPQKTYEGDDVLSLLWAQFEGALHRAKRVLVIGHSLADQLLVRALTTQVQPPHDRVAITVFSDGKGGPDPSAQPLVEWIRENLPRAKMIPMRFGNPLNYREDTLDAWISETKKLGIA